MGCMDTREAASKSADQTTRVIGGVGLGAVGAFMVLNGGSLVLGLSLLALGLALLVFALLRR